MSELQDIGQQVSAVAGEISYWSQQLHAKAGQLRQAAARAAQAVGSADGEGGKARLTAQALAHAADCCDRAAQHLVGGKSAAEAFVQMHIGAGRSGAGTATPSGATGAAGEAGNRYLTPDDQTRSMFQTLVGVFGPQNPEGWISSGNPNFSSGSDAWIKNCGPCSRSFADTYQGYGTEPALGDSRVPPGEYMEMWDALGARPTRRVTNDSAADPATFTAAAYQRLATALAGEPPGTVAIIGVDWDLPGVAREDSGGHWFNAYVDNTHTVRWADEQIGRTDSWPPPYVASIWQCEAVVRRPGTRTWEGVDL